MIRVKIVSGFEAGREGYLVRRCPSGALVVMIDGYRGPVTLSPNNVILEGAS
jgi:hypothetical protein